MILLIICIFIYIYIIRKCRDRLENEVHIWKPTDFEHGKVAIVTGGTGTIGKALVIELGHSGFEIILIVRNVEKAKKMISEKIFKNFKIIIIKGDVSDVESMKNAIFEIKNIVKRVDLMFLNAGFIPSASLHWPVIYEAIKSFKNINYFFITSRARVNGRSFISSTNVSDKCIKTQLYGHYMLCNGFKDILNKCNGYVIWTSSRCASKYYFENNFINFPLCGITDQYGTSKYLLDLLSVGLNMIGIPSLVACPGFVETDESPWPIRLLKPFLWIIATFQPSWRVSARRGAEVLMQLAHSGGTIIKETPETIIKEKNFRKWAMNGTKLMPVEEGVEMEYDLELSKKLISKLQSIVS
eukprot:GHVL01018685.1.p1 GENE.GHVL01018685.1~~GHVL01018685.1.p1  ORF type:complete len:355 (+),score=80.11 GHVL01018685.1:22-1086(+)